MKTLTAYLHFAFHMIATRCHYHRV